MGMNTYYIDEPTLLFIPPTEIISWKSLADHSKAYYCVFKKTFVDEHPNLKTVIDKFHLFSDPGRWVVRLKDKEVPALVKLFEQMEDETASGSPLAEDTIQAYLQLVMIESIKIANYPKPDSTNDEFRHIHQFFHLLERETASINYINPIRIKTAKEFAADLSLTPNYLNALLKKHTGQNVSTHIRNRLLDESKALLLQTDWTVQDIGYAIGFADQPNFSTFFKKLTGITPIDFRKQQNS
jgi:AraC-like DNA-binding protein